MAQSPKHSTSHSVKTSLSSRKAATPSLAASLSSRLSSFFSPKSHNDLSKSLMGGDIEFGLPRDPSLSQLNAGGTSNSDEAPSVALAHAEKVDADLRQRPPGLQQVASQPLLSAPPTALKWQPAGHVETKTKLTPDIAGITLEVASARRDAAQVALTQASEACEQFDENPSADSVTSGAATKQYVQVHLAFKEAQSVFEAVRARDCKNTSPTAPEANAVMTVAPEYKYEYAKPSIAHRSCTA